MSYFWKTLWANIGSKLLFNTTCHPQTDDQTKVVNLTLSSLLRSLVSKNLKSWDNYLALVEFSYNQSVHGTPKRFNALTPLDLTTLPIKDRVCIEGKKTDEHIKVLHEHVKQEIEMNKKYSQAVNKGRK